MKMIYVSVAWLALSAVAQAKDVVLVEKSFSTEIGGKLECRTGERMHFTHVSKYDLAVIEPHMERIHGLFHTPISPATYYSKTLKEGACDTLRKEWKEKRPDDFYKEPHAAAGEYYINYLKNVDVKKVTKLSNGLLLGNCEVAITDEVSFTLWDHQFTGRAKVLLDISDVGDMNHEACDKKLEEWSEKLKH